MNNLAYLHAEDETDNGIIMVNVPAYKTSDGKVFHNRSDAERHEAEEQLVDLLVATYNSGINRISGSAIRGHGVEWVPANQNEVRQYTKKILNHLRNTNLLK